MTAMRVQIDVGEYGDTSLDDWICGINSRLSFIESQIIEINTTLEAIKKIVPLVDEDLGMHDAPSTSVS